MKLTTLDHIGVAVPDLGAALKGLALLGASPETACEEVPAQGVRVAFIPLRDCNVELLEPLAEDSPVGRFLQKRGSGVHHLAFEVDDIEARLAELAEQGVELVDRTPRRGAGGKLIAFLHPRSTGGVLIELCQKVKGKP